MELLLEAHHIQTHSLVPIRRFPARVANRFAFRYYQQLSLFDRSGLRSLPDAIAGPNF